MTEASSQTPIPPPASPNGARPLTLGLQVLDHDSWMGGTIYVRNLVYALDALEPAERPSVRLIGAEHARQSLIEELASFDFVERPAARTGLLSLAGRATRRIGRSLTGAKPPGPFDGIDIVFPSLHTEHAVARPLFWIPDFQHEHMPALFSEEDLAGRQAKDAAIAAAGGDLVLSSHMALEDFRRIYPEASTRPHVWSFCSTMTVHERDGCDPHATYGIPRKYLYIPNQFWAHKNHETAFRALRILSAKKVRDIDIVCTGYEHDSRNRGHVETLKAFIAEAGLTERVHFLGLVPRNDQIEIFRHAAAVLQPSLFEGWSTVVEDTKALGRPLILSDFPVHKEQVGEDGHFFPGRDAAALAALVERLWPTLAPGPDPEAEAAASRKGERRRIEAARAFLHIARTACAVGTPQ